MTKPEHSASEPQNLASQHALSTPTWRNIVARPFAALPLPVPPRLFTAGSAAIQAGGVGVDDAVQLAAHIARKAHAAHVQAHLFEPRHRDPLRSQACAGQVRHIQGKTSNDGKTAKPTCFSLCIQELGLVPALAVGEQYMTLVALARGPQDMPAAPPCQTHAAPSYNKSFCQLRRADYSSGRHLQNLPDLIQS